MNIKAIATKIGIDYENVLEDFCGDVSALGEMLQAFSEASFSSKLKEALDKADHESIKSLAHKIRNNSEKLGLSTIAKAARRVEDADLDKIKNATIVLIEKIDEAVAAIDQSNNEE